MRLRFRGFGVEGVGFFCLAPQSGVSPIVHQILALTPYFFTEPLLFKELHGCLWIRARRAFGGLTGDAREQNIEFRGLISKSSKT